MTPESPDWCALLLGLPRRRYTAPELARGGGGAPPWALRIVAMLNWLPLVAVAAWSAAQEGHWAFAAGVALFALLLLCVADAAWRSPSHAWVRRAHVVIPLVIGAALGWAGSNVAVSQRTLALTAVALLLGVVAMWFVIVYRHHAIGARLREQDERDRALALARQLAAAQIKPHFLFNALATLQQWVTTKDDRANALLRALTGYLRATLPLFDQTSLTLAQEMDAVRRYLEVMQARLGERLAFDMDLPQALASQRLPPGVLLTLVENAVEHGVQPQLRGGRVRIAAARDGAWLHATVADNGPGVPADQLHGTPASSDHLGLANTRSRLAGIGASLSLSNPAHGGCTATVRWPFDATLCTTP